jgi:hypothetical protein
MVIKALCLSSFSRLRLLQLVTAIALPSVACIAPASAQPLLSEALRSWAIVGVSPVTTSTRTKLRSGSVIDADVCSDLIYVGSGVMVQGRVAATLSSQPSAIKIRPNADLGGDVVTAGGRVTAIPRSHRLPGLFIGFVEPNSLRPFRTGVGVYDTTGTHPVAESCVDAQNDLRALIDDVAGLPSTQDEGRVRLLGLSTKTIVPANVGGRNVIDVDSILMDKRTGLAIDGGGNPNTTVILRVHRRLRTRIRSQIVATGGLTADRLLIVVEGARCKIGERNVGQGTLFCAANNFRLRAGTVWEGALFSSAAKFEAGDRLTLVTVPGDGL